MTPPPGGWLLDPGVVYLNHGSFGACPLWVAEYREKLLREAEAEPMDFLVRRLQGELTLQLRALEDFLGASCGSLVFTDNTTTGINSVIRSMGLRPGDTVLVSNRAYFSTRNALLEEAARAGARVKTVAYTSRVGHPGELVQQTLDALDPSVRFAVLDHIESPTGMVFPLGETVRALRERGVETAADGAHGPGHLPMNLEELGCAWYVGNCHKWICSPRSAAVLHVREDYRASTRPAVTSHVPEDFLPGPDPLRVMFDWSGTPDPTPRLCVRATLEHMASRHPGGWPGIMERNRKLALEARALLLDATCAESPCPDSMVGCMAAVTLPPLESPGPRSMDWFDPVQQALRDRGFEVPVIQAAGERFLRVSAQLYNAPGQYRDLAAALREILGT